LRRQYGRVLKGVWDSRRDLRIDHRVSIASPRRHHLQSTGQEASKNDYLTGPENSSAPRCKCCAYRCENRLSRVNARASYKDAVGQLVQVAEGTGITEDKLGANATGRHVVRCC
jgi:hypothetical protein